MFQKFKHVSLPKKLKSRMLSHDGRHPRGGVSVSPPTFVFEGDKCCFHSILPLYPLKFISANAACCFKIWALWQCRYGLIAGQHYSQVEQNSTVYDRTFQPAAQQFRVACEVKCFHIFSELIK